MKSLLISLHLGLLLLLSCYGAQAQETPFNFGRFGAVTVYVPVGPPTRIALFISGDSGWNLGVVHMAQALRDSGALVAGIDIRHFLAELSHSKSQCEYLAADFEELSHALQKRFSPQHYHVPVLVGYSSGATLAYAVAAQSPSGTFAGALSLGFCPDLQFANPPCRSNDLAFTAGNKTGEVIFQPVAAFDTPWIAMQGAQDQVCDASATQNFVSQVPGAELLMLPKVGHGYSVPRNWEPQFQTAFLRLAAGGQPTVQSEPGIGDLPIEVVPATGKTSRRMALLITGDGGWAGLDRNVSAGLSAQGIPVVALNSLQYFWKKRTPAATAQDVTRLLRHYLQAWSKDEVIMVGYSFGADVMPFVVNRLPEDLRARIASVNLLGPAQKASFEVHVSSWLGADTGELPSRPEIERLQRPVQCIYGEDEHGSICPEFSGTQVHVLRVGAGHHFGGEYAVLAKHILEFSGL